MKRHSPQKAILLVSLMMISFALFFHYLNFTDQPPVNIKKTVNGVIQDNEEAQSNEKPQREEAVSYWKEILNYVKKPFIFVDGHGAISSVITLIIGFIAGCYQSEIRVFFYKIFIYYRKIKNYKAHINDSKKYNSIELPFPGCSIKELKMGTAYINLSFKNDKEHAVEEYMSAQEIIKDAQHKYLMIIGSPGSGKSTLCKNIVYQYSINTLADKIPIFIELGKNIHPNNIKKTVIESIRNSLNIHELDLLIEKKLTKGNFRIIFDAFDEVSTNDIDTVNDGIVNFIEKYNECAYIITCRKSVSDHFKKRIHIKNIETFEIRDLRIQDIENYVKEWKKQDNSLDVNTFLSHLDERSKIRELAKEPLMVALSIYLFIKDRSLPYSRTTFYDKLSKYLVNKNERNEFDINIIHSLSRIAWEIQQTYDNTDDKGNHRISLNSAQKIAGKNSEEILSTLKKSGLLRKSDLQGNTYYEFPLKTHREYYVAYYMKYIHEECKNEEEKQKILLDKYNAHSFNYREIVKFYCGMCKEEDNVSKLIEELHNYDLKHKSTVALEALSESKNVNEIADVILNYYFSIDVNIWQEVSMDISKKLGAIVSNISEDGYKQVGEKVFVKLKDFFEEIHPKNEEMPITYKNLVFALASSFTQEASQVLVDYYHKNDKTIHDALINMGNVSVEHLGKFAEGGNIKAVDCLANIGTDKAIKELIRIIFSGKENESITRIAWYLAQTESIEKMNSIDNLLDIDNLKREENTINYTWLPFGNQEDPQVYIMNRISYLLLNTPINRNIPSNVIIDNRLLIPLQIESRKNNSKHNRATEAMYTRYIKREHAKNTFKKIDDVLQNPSYKTMNYNDWCKEWKDINKRNSAGEYCFSKKEINDYLFPIIFLGFASFLFLIIENNKIVIIGLPIAITFIFIVGIRHVDKETYSDNKLMSYLGLKSKLELLYLLLIVVTYIFTSPLFFPFNKKGGGLFFLDFLILYAMIILIFLRYKKWNSNSIFSKLLEELKIKN